MDNKRPGTTGGGAALTAALVVSKTKSDSLQNIKNLNLWGNDLQDLKLLREMPSLEVVSLSVNRISSLKQFGYCPKLKQLYLRKNNINDIREIKYLMKLPNLGVLWLHDNPCANIDNYREIVIKFLPKLIKLDNSQVSGEERGRAQKVNFNLDSYQETGGYEREDSRNNQSNRKSQRQEEEYESQKRSDPKIQQRERGRDMASFGQQPQQYEPQPQSKKPVFSKAPQVRRQQTNKWDRQQRPSSTPFVNQSQPKKPQTNGRNKNILLAVVSLLKQLDSQSLQIVRMEVDKLMDQ